MIISRKLDVEFQSNISDSYSPDGGTYTEFATNQDYVDQKVLAYEYDSERNKKKGVYIANGRHRLVTLPYRNASLPFLKKDECIRIENATNGIDLYRVMADTSQVELYKLMRQDQDVFLENELAYMGETGYDIPIPEGQGRYYGVETAIWADYVSTSKIVCGTTRYNKYFKIYKYPYMDRTVLLDAFYVMKRTDTGFQAAQSNNLMDENIGTARCLVIDEVDGGAYFHPFRYDYSNTFETAACATRPADLKMFALPNNPLTYPFNLVITPYDGKSTSLIRYDDLENEKPFNGESNSVFNIANLEPMHRDATKTAALGAIFGLDLSSSYWNVLFYMMIDFPDTKISDICVYLSKLNGIAKIWVRNDGLTPNVHEYEISKSGGIYQTVGQNDTHILVAFHTPSIGGVLSKSIGEIVVGEKMEIGDTNLDFSFGLKDYSYIENDKYGVETRIERAKVRVMSYLADIESDAFDDTVDVLESNVGNPAVIDPAHSIDKDKLTKVAVFGRFNNVKINPVIIDNAIAFYRYSVDIEEYV